MTDRQLLDAVCMANSRLAPHERRAFLDMRQRMHAGRMPALSYAQRAWLQEAAARIGLGAKEVDGWRQVAKGIRDGS